MVLNGPSRASRAARRSSPAGPPAADGRNRTSRVSSGGGGRPGGSRRAEPADGDRGAPAEAEDIPHGREDGRADDPEPVRPETGQRHGDRLTEVTVSSRQRPLPDGYLTRAARQVTPDEHGHE